MRITGDDWIMATVTQDLITLSHKSPKEPIIEGQDESSSTEKQNIILNFGDTFPMTNHSFDDKGHKFKSETYTIQIPKLNFTSSGTGDIVTKLEFSDNNLAETKTNLGAIKLGTYQKPESLSENITETSTLQEALIILENRISNLPTYTLTTGSNNGTVAFNGTNVTVKGLGSAAYTDAGTYATSAQGAKADSALQSNTQFKYGEEDQKTIEELFSLVFQLSAKVVELEEKIKLEHPDPELDEGNTEII